jgi:hypothetical protein
MCAIYLHNDSLDNLSNQIRIRCFPLCLISPLICYLGAIITARIRLFAECQAVCRVFFLTLGKEDQVPNKKHSAKKKHLANQSLLSVDTRQRLVCRVFFWHSANIFFTLGKEYFKSTCWSSKLIQMKKLFTTKFYNFPRSTTFIFLIS